MADYTDVFPPVFASQGAGPLQQRTQARCTGLLGQRVRLLKQVG